MPRQDEIQTSAPEGPLQAAPTIELPPECSETQGRPCVATALPGFVLAVGGKVRYADIPWLPRCVVMVLRNIRATFCTCSTCCVAA